MKKPVILLMVTAIIAISYFIHYHRMNNKASIEEEASWIEEEHEQEEYEEEKEEEAGADKQLSMLFHARAYPDPYYMTDKYLRAWDQAIKLKQDDIRRSMGSRTQAASWSSIGPVGTIGGRIICLTIDPNNSNNLWAGSASGGIWKSTNAGGNWSSVPTNLPVLGVSSILVDPSNSNVIYAGTGEVYRVDTSNLGFNVWKTRGTYGIGIIKSINGGTTWSQVMMKSTSQLYGIQKLVFDPTNSNTIYACATDGLHRSTDNGVTWTQILSKIYVKSIVINPTNTNQIVVSVGNMVNSDKGIYRTTNGNNATPTWTKITTGLPATFQGSIKLDNSGAGLIMASIGISSSTAASNREIYSSTDFGATWTVVGGTTAGTTTNHCSYQFWFAHTVAINPFTTDSIMFAGVNWYRYRVSTTARTTISGGHADVHDIKYDPVNRGRIYVCCDGGIYKSTNGGAGFTKINTGLDATQFYASLGVSRTNANVMIGGLQDNGQVLYNGTSWTSIAWGGGDGTSCAIDPNNDLRMLASRDAKQIFRSTNGGSTGGSVTSYWGFVADSRTGFVAPLAFSKTRSDSVYLGSDNLHTSTDGGATWNNDNYSTATNYIEARNKTAIALAVSPKNSQKVYVSTSPFAQADNDIDSLYRKGQPNILKTTTGGTPFTSIKNGLPDRFVMDFAISPTNDDSVFIVLGGFGSTSHVYVTGNGGSSWTALGGATLPDVPFNAIVIDPINPRVIYAGGDLGVYVSADRGATWVDFNSGFWDATLVMDLQITADNKIVAATHGKGIFKSDLFTASTLPVTLLEFTGKGYSNYNELKWKVAQEVNLNRYELEKSSDGIRFTNLSRINAKNSVNEISYSYQDIIYNNQSAVSYYRLKMIDNDGSFTYSQVILLKKTGKNEIVVLTNPFPDHIMLQYSFSQTKKLKAILFDGHGKKIQASDVTIPEGVGIYPISTMQALNRGIYFLRIDDGKQKWNFKLLKE